MLHVSVIIVCIDYTKYVVVDDLRLSVLNKKYDNGMNYTVAT
jgi:hypothetical protein